MAYCIFSFGLVVFTDEDGGAENGGPEAALVADGGLRDVHGADDLVGDAIDFLFFRRTTNLDRIPRSAWSRAFPRRALRHIRRRLLRFPRRNDARTIAIHGFVAGQRQADARSDEAVRSLVEFSLMTVNATWPGLDVLQSFTARNQFAVGRENGGDANDVARGNASVPQSELRNSRALSRCLPTPLVRKIFLANERHGAVCRASVSSVRAKNFPAVESNKKVLQCQRNSGP